MYLNELDYFVKHKLKAECYVRYVDDFVIMHKSPDKLTGWKEEINCFLNSTLKLKLHPDKSRIIHLSNGVDFVGFRNFYYFNLLRKRNMRKIKRQILNFSDGKIGYARLTECFQGWQAHAKWANTYNLRRFIAQKIARVKYFIPPASQKQHQTFLPAGAILLPSPHLARASSPQHKQNSYLFSSPQNRSHTMAE